VNGREHTSKTSRGDSGAVVVVSPTYNEVDNVEALAEGVLSSSPRFQLLIVDDNSPDGTSELTRELSRKEPRVKLLHRERREGYGRAIAAGLRAALGEGVPYVVTMDADGSHDTEAISSLVSVLERADMVIGSRYVPGGGIRRWPWRRRVLSRGANAYVDRVLSLPVKDCTSGFRGFRAETLRRCDPAAVEANGYAFLIEHLFRVARAGLTIEEVPIQFTDRERGSSNLTLDVFVESVLNPWRIRRSSRT
jgi:dolichol-phosphate mannosyltransferase